MKATSPTPASINAARRNTLTPKMITSVARRNQWTSAVSSNSILGITTLMQISVPTTQSMTPGKKNLIMGMNINAAKRT